MRNIALIAFLLIATLNGWATTYQPNRTNATISLKVAGNEATLHELTFAPDGTNRYRLSPQGTEAIEITQQVETKNQAMHLTTTITAREALNFRFDQAYMSGFLTDNCQYLLPGFWYRRNLRSPDNSPSYRVAESWSVREDRLSSPYCAIYDEPGGRYISVLRLDNEAADALTTHPAGEVILSGSSSLGYVGFENKEGNAHLTFGYPYRETPKSYVRKLTLAPSVEAFQYMNKGETIQLKWVIAEEQAQDYAQVVRKSWEHCLDTNAPEVVESSYSTERMKSVLSNFFVEAYVDKYPLKYYSGEGLRTADCQSNAVAEVGFVGRTLLNAFNAYEYGMEQNREDLKHNALGIFNSYLEHGFSPAGFIREKVNFDRNSEEPSWSIRRQSEGIYAMLHFLNYERKHKRRHPQWEERLKTTLNTMLTLQNSDGSFPRKFHDNLSIADASGGSTSTVILPLAMAYRYFKHKPYYEAAKRSMKYIEEEIIDKSDYFSSTLDANCEDKEASLYSAMAAYYMMLISPRTERAHYAEMAREATYFALSWYYTWDVPFARGQMLGDIGLKSRGWGNVSVENNHIDVYVFEFVTLLNRLAAEFNEPRFEQFAQVINTSMRQLLPYPGHLCGIARTGYYPEVVQHTQWDYGKNGKGFYNDIFAPGWTVASLWEMLSPGRTEQFFGTW